jgi:hypothetical protein
VCRQQRSDATLLLAVVAAVAAVAVAVAVACGRLLRVIQQWHIVGSGRLVVVLAAREQDWE